MVDFINPFKLCAKLLCSTPNFYALRQNFMPKKASQKSGAEHKSLVQSVNSFMKSTQARAMVYPVLLKRKPLGSKREDIYRLSMACNLG